MGLCVTKSQSSMQNGFKKKRSVSSSVSSNRPSLRRQLSTPPPRPNRSISSTAGINRNTVIALYSFEARDTQDLPFAKGDRMEVIKEEEEGWLYVAHLTNGHTGYIPSNFVAPDLGVEKEEWYFEHLTRKEAENALMCDENHRIGTFLVRPSKDYNQLGSKYALSVKDWAHESGYLVKHYRIMTRDGKYYLNSRTTCRTLQELVTEYCIRDHGLGVTLTRPCHRPEPLLTDFGFIYKDQWEIPREEIQLLQSLGVGNFGEVRYGKWKNTHPVAVKVLRKGQMTKQEFLREAAIMKKFRHKRLVQLYGICSLEEPMYIIQEYMSKGSLLQYLRKDQGRTLCFNDLVYIAYQVAEGMAHLESLNFIHRDLAARNILLGENNVAKVGDFGLSRIMDQEEYAIVRGSGKFPLKWTAPEALEKSIFTLKSDVWSYGVLLMELFTYGAEPYEGIAHMDVFGLVKHGYRMSKPVNLTDELHETMLCCWHEEPGRRPTFKYLSNLFEGSDPGGCNLYMIVY